MSTNTFRYTTCCAANVYMFVYILIGAPIVHLIMFCVGRDTKFTLPQTFLIDLMLMVCENFVFD